jgi:hypothetical protein
MIDMVWLTPFFLCVLGALCGKSFLPPERLPTFRRRHVRAYPVLNASTGVACHLLINLILRRLSLMLELFG